MTENWQKIIGVIDDRIDFLNRLIEVPDPDEPKSTWPAHRSGAINSLLWLKKQAEEIARGSTEQDLRGGHTESFDVVSTVTLYYQNGVFIVEHDLPSSLDDGLYKSYTSNFDNALEEYNQLKKEMTNA